MSYAQEEQAWSDAQERGEFDELFWEPDGHGGYRFRDDAYDEIDRLTELNPRRRKARQKKAA